MLATLAPACERAAGPAHTNPTAAVAAALDSVWVVALGEHHGHVEFHAWLLEALADSAIQRRVDDVAVEFGNARYQDMADRFVAGKDVPLDSVRLIWRNTVVSPNPVWDSPVYEAFVLGLRRINAARTDGRRYRLLLLDPPVEWSTVRSRADLAPFLDRAGHMAERMESEVLRPGRHALLVAGGAHLTRANMVRTSGAGVPTAEVSVAARLAQRHPGALFVVRSVARTGSLAPDWLPTVPPGRLLRTDQPPFTTTSANAVSTMRNMDGTPFTLYGTATLADLADAIIYWGPPDQNHFAEPGDDVLSDRAYHEERNRRSLIVRGRPLD